MKGQGIKGPYFPVAQCVGKLLPQELPLHPGLSQETVPRSLVQMC